MAQAETSPEEAFSASFAQFGKLASFLASDGAMAAEHSEVEERIFAEGMEALRLLFQDHFDLRAAREARQAGVTDAAGVEHPMSSPGMPGSSRPASAPSSSPVTPTATKGPRTSTPPTPRPTCPQSATPTG